MSFIFDTCLESKPFFVIFHTAKSLSNVHIDLCIIISVFSMQKVMEAAVS